MGRDAMRVGFALSLALNVLALGVIGGAAIAWLKLDTAPPRHPLRDAGLPLEPSDRQRFEATLKTFGQATRPLRLAARDGRRDAAQLFTAQSFDASSVNAALARARAADFELRTRLETTIVSFAATLPQKERTKLAAGLARGGPLRQAPRPKR